MTFHQAQTHEQMPKLTKLRIIKNLAFISLSFFLLFTAFDGLSMLQSTMNKKAGIGVISQAVGYISFFVSAFLLPKYVIKKIGCKSSLILALSFFLPCIAANFCPEWYVMIPSGILGGIGASILWGSQCTYFNESAVRYSKLITDGSVNPNLSSAVPSNCTSFEVLTERNSISEISEENPSKNNQSKKDKLEVKNLEDSVMRYACKNSKCGNVDEFTVSEIKKKCVQFLRNGPNSNNAQDSGLSENLPATDISLSPIQTDINDIKIIKENGHEGAKISKLEAVAKSEVADSEDSVSPKKNPDHQPIFQKANTLEFVTGVFFGCHGMAYYSAQICSNALSYYVMKGDGVPEITYFSNCTCGAQFCNDDLRCISDNTEYVSNSIRYLLTGICVVIASISVFLVLFFVDPLKKAKAEDETEKISLRLVSATFNHNKKKEQLCLVPLTFFEGMQQGFYTADFTKSYVGCAWGVSNVGLVSVFYGSACVVSASSSGFLIKYVGRLPLFLIGQVISIWMIIYLLLWNPDYDTPYKFHIAATFFGALTGIYWTQLLAFHGLLFKKDEEAAFASYYLWSSLGWTTSFLYSDHLCTYVKIYLLLTVSIIGTIGYLFAERYYLLRKQLGTVAST